MVFLLMTALNLKKLLSSKWTAVNPSNKEKHFIVTKLLDPDVAGASVEHVELESVYSRRVRVIAWRDLLNTDSWRTGWK